MAQKKESETLRQRRIAQQEFLRLKKMQKGELDAGPKPSEVATPLTFGEKLQNIWFHDKFAIIIIGLLIIAIALLVTQCATKTVYDANIVLFTHTMTGDPNCDKMGEYLKPYCKDINGDGEVNVNVINCSIDEGINTQYTYTNRSKMQSLLAAEASALLFITDDSSYKYLMGLSDDVALFEGEPFKFQADFYEYCIDESGFYETPEGLQISCRTIKDTAIEKDKNVEKHYDQAYGVISQLKREYGKQQAMQEVEQTQ